MAAIVPAAALALSPPYEPPETPTKPAAASAPVAPAPATSSAPATSASAPAPVPAENCRLVYVFENETVIRSLPGGELGIDKQVTPANDGCRKRYASRTLPLPMRDLRKCDAPSKIAYHHFEGIDAQQAAWFSKFDSNKRTHTVSRALNGTLTQMTFDSSNMGGQIGGRPVEPRWPLVGKDVLVESGGTVWVAGADGLIKITGTERHTVPMPVYGTEKEQHDLTGSKNNPCWDNRLYNFGSSRWLTRSFTSNCHKPGSFVLCERDGGLTVLERFHDRYVTGLVRHGEFVYMLIERRTIRDYGTDDWTCDEIRRVALGGQAPAAQPNKALPCDESSLGGAEAGRLLLVDDKGRQYVHVWRKNAPTPDVLVVSATGLAQVKLPDAAVSLDCIGDDGLIYGISGRQVVAVDGGDERRRPSARAVITLPEQGPQNVRVAGVSRSMVCLSYGSNTYEPTQVLLDPTTPPDLPVLRGKAIATGLERRSNEGMHYPIVPGPDGKLWFAKLAAQQPGQHGQPNYAVQLCTADGAEVKEHLEEAVSFAGNPSIFVAGPKTAVVVAAEGRLDNRSSVLFHDRGAAREFNSLIALAEDQEDALLETLPDGVIFACGDWHERAVLARIGNAIYVKGQEYKTDRHGGGFLSFSGLRRKGDWALMSRAGFGQHDAKPLFGRLFGLDPSAGKALVFSGDYLTAGWYDLNSNDIAAIATCEQEWAWYWPNLTASPRIEGAWWLTPQAGAYLVTVAARRQAENTDAGREPWDIEMREDDFLAFWRWRDGEWRMLPYSLWGGCVWEDASGSVWHMRVREACVYFEDGRRQIIPLDAGALMDYRLVVESKNAVWVASAQSLTRFVLTRDARGRPLQWRADQRASYALPMLGAYFQGPWICGSNVYWCSGSTLYHAELSALVADKMP
jgi:hypothetical protein